MDVIATFLLMISSIVFIMGVGVGESVNLLLLPASIFGIALSIIIFTGYDRLYLLPIIVVLTNLGLLLISMFVPALPYADFWDEALYISFLIFIVCFLLEIILQQMFRIPAVLLLLYSTILTSLCIGGCTLWEIYHPY